MCLTVNKKIHTNFKPLVAKYDIQVIKLLCCHLNETVEYVTPYFFKIVNFKNGKCMLKTHKFTVEFLKNPLQQKVYDMIISEGIHSMTSIAPQALLSQHYAIIPKGTKFFIGTDCDIVSKKLIIFQSQSDYFSYKVKRNVKTIAELFDDLSFANNEE